MGKGYYTYNGEFYQIDDIKTLCVGKYTDIASGREVGYWVDNNGYISRISESTYDTLVKKGIAVSERDTNIYLDYNTEGFILIENIHEITLFVCKDIESGRVSGYMAEDTCEHDISESTYNALADAGASESEYILYSFTNVYTGEAIEFNDAHQIKVEKIIDVDSGHVGGYKAWVNDVECGISESTYEALIQAGAKERMVL